MVTIYVSNKPLFLTDNVNGLIETHLHQPGTFFTDKFSDAAIDAVLTKMEGNNVSTGIFQHDNVSELLNAFKSKLRLVKAAGGFVYTGEKEVLLIFRRGKWDLPKGKLDEGEDLESCARREVEEETGLANTTIIKPLQITYHTYFERGEHILKESHWYLMQAYGNTALMPQTEEDIEECRWVPLTELEGFLNKMHASLISVVKEAKSLLQEAS